MLKRGLVLVVLVGCSGAAGDALVGAGVDAGDGGAVTLDASGEAAADVGADHHVGSTYDGGADGPLADARDEVLVDAGLDDVVDALPVCGSGRRACGSVCIPASSCCQSGDCTVTGEVCPTPGGTCSCPAGQRECGGTLNACIPSGNCCTTADCYGQVCPVPGEQCQCPAGSAWCAAAGLQGACLRPGVACCTSADCPADGGGCSGPGGSCYP